MIDVFYFKKCIDGRTTGALSTVYRSQSPSPTMSTHAQASGWSMGTMARSPLDWRSGKRGRNALGARGAAAQRIQTAFTQAAAQAQSPYSDPPRSTAVGILTDTGHLTSTPVVLTIARDSTIPRYGPRNFVPQAGACPLSSCWGIVLYCE